MLELEHSGTVAREFAEKFASDKSRPAYEGRRFALKQLDEAQSAIPLGNQPQRIKFHCN